jgi:hypothetical protein
MTSGCALQAASTEEADSAEPALPTYAGTVASDIPV